VQAPPDLAQQPVQAPPDTAQDVPPAPRSAPKSKDTSVDDILAGIVSSEKAPSARKTSSTDEEVDKLLSDTLSGLDIAALRKRSAGAEKPTEASSQQISPPTTKQPVAPSAAPGPRTPSPPVQEPSEKGAAPAAPTRKARPTPPGEKTPVRKGHPPSPDRPAPSGTEFGQYVIEEHIATGGMADVYKARMMGMEGFQKTVAIKRILSNLTDSDEFVRMFIDEAKLAAQLSHNNIIHIFDLGKVDRSHYIAMEYIEGRDLRSILEECRERDITMPIELSLYITNLLASALDYAHKKRDFDNRALGLVHRDVSPQNVLISFDGDVKLCDFGIAKAASKATQTRAGALKGKLQYMSPEQAWGKDIDHRSDLFSLGLVLFEMLTNEKVFSGTSELSVLEQVRDPIITAPSMKNPDVDAEIDRIIFLALNAEREERYQSAEDMKRDLERVIRSRETVANRSSLVTFLESVGSVKEVETPSGAADEPQPPAEPPASPPPPPTPPEPSSPQTPSQPPPSIAQDAVSTADEDHEAVLPTPTPSVESVRMELEDSGFRTAKVASGGGRKSLWILLAALGLVIIGAGGWFIFGRQKPQSPAAARAVPIVAVATATPTPEPTMGLMSDQELIDRAREVAAAEITKQEEELRKRLEEEFPTPTPIPPTPTPTDTPTPLPTDTPTPVPPTATSIPPTATPIPPTPTPSVREGDIVVAGPGVVPPVMIYRESPKYPPAAERMGAAGEVEAEALIGIDGTVEEVRITRVEGRDFGFEKATEEAIYKWRYKPATKKGVKVRVWVTVRVPFRLQ
jgi:TonB family protein